VSRFDRFKRKVATFGDGSDRIQINDPRYDDWEVVHELGDLETGLAWKQVLLDNGIEAVLTSDWELDRFNRGDIQLQVPPGMWSEAEVLVSGIDLD